MKSGIWWKWNLGVSLISLLTVGTGLAEDTAPAVAQSTNSVAASPTNAAAVVAEKKAEGVGATNDIASAPVELVSGEKPLPAGIRPTSPVAEIIKLANSGVEEGVMMAFVTNSTSTFNLGAEEIIYLKDIGVPDPVVTAMILRDQDLRSQFANAAATATPWMAPAENNVPPPPAEQVAPQMENEPAGYPTEPAPPVTEVADDSTFYGDLAPYGNWVNVSGYGACWQPTVVVGNPGWQPYYNCGRWVWTDCGWYWHSDYTWGWAPFHYGRWFRHHNLGWCWAPDHVWGPSWVSWRYTDNYCGWAPLPPGAVYTAGVGMHYRGHSVGHSEDFGLGPEHYRFVSWNNFRSHDLHAKSLAKGQNQRLFRDSVVATRFSGDSHRVVNDGLAPETVARATHVPVRTTLLRDAGTRSHSLGNVERFDSTGKTLTVYRPSLPNSAPSAPRATSAPSAPSAPSSRSQFATRSGTGTVIHYPSANNRTAPAYTGTQTEAVRPTNPGTPAAQAPPLILRGPQSSATRETAPASSLVIIGRKTGTAGNQTYTTYGTTRPAVPATPAPAANASREPLAWNNSATPWVQRNSAAGANSTAARQPTFVPRNNTYNGYERPAQTYRPAPNYQAPVRSAPAEAPRYTPAPANNSAPRVSPAPQAAAPARPAPSAPPVQPSRGQR